MTRRYLCSGNKNIARRLNLVLLAVDSTIIPAIFLSRRDRLNLVLLADDSTVIDENGCVNSRPPQSGSFGR